jgi:HEAT repeat protein
MLEFYMMASAERDCREDLAYYAGDNPSRLVSAYYSTEMNSSRRAMLLRALALTKSEIGYNVVKQAATTKTDPIRLSAIDALADAGPRQDSLSVIRALLEQSDRSEEYDVILRVGCELIGQVSLEQLIWKKLLTISYNPRNVLVKTICSQLSGGRQYWLSSGFLIRVCSLAETEDVRTIMLHLSKMRRDPSTAGWLLLRMQDAEVSERRYWAELFCSLVRKEELLSDVESVDEQKVEELLRWWQQNKEEWGPQLILQR